MSALEDGTYNSHLTIIDKSPSRSTELRYAFQIFMSKADDLDAISMSGT